MTINEKIKEKLTDFGVFLTTLYTAGMNDSITEHEVSVLTEVEVNKKVNEIVSLIQPKTTSTDISGDTSVNVEELKKEGWETGCDDPNCPCSKVSFTEYEKGWNDAIDEVIKLAPHLSNKSELKKEAVMDFARWYEKVIGKPTEIISAAETYLSSNEKGEK